MSSSFFFFFNDTATTEIYTLSLHDALPISRVLGFHQDTGQYPERDDCLRRARARGAPPCHRSEEHTSELQSQSNLVCRLLLEKKKKTIVFDNTVTDNRVYMTHEDIDTQAWL